LAGDYRPFGEIGRAALELTAEVRRVNLSQRDITQIVDGITHLPPHPEVPDSLAQLKAAGFRLVTLTNSPPAALAAQMANANLQHYFERNFSVDSVRKFKPAPEPYRMVARELGTDTTALRLIAAHAWDVGGAMQAGCAGAFVARNGKALFPLMRRPDIIGRDLREVCQAILDT